MECIAEPDGCGAGGFCPAVCRQLSIAGIAPDATIAFSAASQLDAASNRAAEEVFELTGDTFPKYATIPPTISSGAQIKIPANTLLRDVAKPTPGSSRASLRANTVAQTVSPERITGKSWDGSAIDPEFCYNDSAITKFRRGQPRICTVTPEPPVMDVTLARTKFARTPDAIKLSPDVRLVVILVAPVGIAYCASTSFIAVCN
jgi:hypothetical protein